VDADEAKTKAKRIFGKVADGNDPANERAEKRSTAGNTFDKAVTDFLDVQKPRIRPAYYEATDRYLNQHWKALHGLSLPSINRAIVAAELRVIEKARGAVAADRARAALSKFFSWAIGEGLANHNPVDGTNKAAGEYRPRERVLTDDELAAIWKHAPNND